MSVSYAVFSLIDLKSSHGNFTISRNAVSLLYNFLGEMHGLKIPL